MGWRSPGRVIALVMAVVVLVVTVAMWLLVHYDLFPDTDGGSVLPKGAGGSHVVMLSDAGGPPAAA
jgi:hypothetical protein